MQEIKTTTKEFEAYCQCGGNYISDMDMGYNPETKEFDLPTIEWDSCMGSYWQRYANEDARQLALDKYTTNFNAWILNYRSENERILQEKRQETKRLANLKTLGGQFQILHSMKHCMIVN